MKKIKKLITLTIIALISINCENEQLLENGTKEQSVDFKVYAFEPKQIPNITSSIEKASKRSWKSLGSKDEQQPFWVDTKNIVGVQDSLGNTTYSFKTRFEGANLNSIFNIVATKRSDGKEIKPFMMEYEFDDIFSESRKKIAIRYYSLNGFLDGLGNLTGRGDEWNNVPLDPCGEMENSSSSGGSANTGSGGTGTATDPNSPRNSGNRNTYNNYGYYSVVSYGGDNHNSGSGGGKRGYVELGNGCFCDSKPTNALKGGTITGKGDDGDCPKDEMDIAVNEAEFEEKILVELAPETPINDMEKFLKCYNTQQNATFTIYAKQPVKNSSASVNNSGDVGHAFISISQNGNTNTFGFYPSGEGIKSAYGASIIGNNGGDSFDVSLSITISESTLGKIIEKAKNYPNSYNVYNYNCTDYALELANIAGMNIANA